MSTQNEGEGQMGKAAENERIRLKANWYNNLSVGLTLGGVLIPYLILTQKVPDFIQYLYEHRGPSDSMPGMEMIDVPRAFVTLFAFFLAITGARDYRKRADQEIRKLQD
jgi:hypothetical protein